MGTINTPDICPECGSRIQPHKKGDFFGKCSWPCLERSNKRYQAERATAARPKPIGDPFARRGAI